MVADVELKRKRQRVQLGLVSFYPFKGETLPKMNGFSKGFCLQKRNAFYNWIKLL